MKKYILPILVLLAIIAVIFVWLGGSSSLEYSLVEQEEIALYGYEYRGRPTQPELEKLFFKVRDASSFETGRFLTIISYGTEAEVDTLYQFIGTQHSSFNADSSVQKIVEGGQFVQVTLDMHAMVRPSPANVRKGAVDFARDKGLQVADWNLEIFTAEDVLTVLFPVVD
ncbi:hypothetical protein [Fulvivirga sedimenti]|uniref:Uncharacterized protein n=1 Tax=Fulvivirga sedimenti TaxID=2879465 RepID=A0A9X1HVY5_9BACT|nr:hypothetical protein [Fulvivirga sedimenti]MCA6078656.1 hypothetical protein [Fulvivirga sedimenti]